MSLSSRLENEAKSEVNCSALEAPLEAGCKSESHNAGPHATLPTLKGEINTFATWWKKQQSWTAAAQFRKSNVTHSIYLYLCLKLCRILWVLCECWLQLIWVTELDYLTMFVVLVPFAVCVLVLVSEILLFLLHRLLWASICVCTTQCGAPIYLLDAPCWPCKPALAD